ncbi:NBR1-Ig-like domain-containing protein [Longimicrobium sp.]|uniref:NBR1-Ig-like domain-containing protein n=1 Tax=Longimicrobium sp. TaxID=2029185 RepID=UPI002BF47609|nr:NBR1-Ig-like domain-containing protein [Longimicrobium sp.]HSU16575.1 NBR1-Ig-like domain-containing protein [Longimicrobium sp.]
MPLFLHTFGTPALRGEHGDVRLNAKELALLVYLRVTARAHTRGALGRLLWSNISIGRNNSVNTAISALRRSLPEGAIPPGADPVMLAGDLACDADAVLADAAVGDSAAFSRALEAHRAPFLDGFEFRLGEGAESFLAWMEERRAGFSTGLQRGLEEHLAAASSTRDWSRVRELARKGRESLPGWTGDEEWTSRAKQARVSARIPRLGMALAACGVGIMLLTGPGTPGAASTCRPGEARAQLVRQTYPAEANLAIRTGERYTPTWYLRNVGTCAWGAGARVVRVRAFGPAQLSSNIAARIGHVVQPGGVAEVGIGLRGPKPAGRYGEDWVLQDGFAKPVSIAEGAALHVRFQVLPPRLPVCRAGEVVAELLAQSHPRRDTRVRPGERIPVSWSIANRGECVWDSSVALRFRSASGPRLSDSTLSVIRVEEPVLPSFGYAFHVSMQAPGPDGSYLEAWELTGPDGGVVRVSDEPGVDIRLIVSREGEIRASAAECAPGEEVVTFMNTESVVDGSTVSPGAWIPKEWTLLNRGDCTWPKGALRLTGVRSDPEFANRSLPQAVTGRPVPPQGTYTFRAPFRGPSIPGHYRVHWQMYNNAGDSVRISRTYTIWADFDVRGGTGANLEGGSTPRSAAGGSRP